MMFIASHERCTRVSTDLSGGGWKLVGEAVDNRQNKLFCPDRAGVLFGQVLGPGVSVDDNERKLRFCASLPNARTEEGDKQPRVYHADGFRPPESGYARTINRNLYKLRVSKLGIVNAPSLRY
jgi:hypothetical protein